MPHPESALHPGEFSNADHSLFWRKTFSTGISALSSMSTDHCDAAFRRLLERCQKADKIPRIVLPVTIERCDDLSAGMINARHQRRALTHRRECLTHCTIGNSACISLSRSDVPSSLASSTTITSNATTDSNAARISGINFRRFDASLCAGTTTDKTGSFRQPADSGFRSH